MKTRTLIEQDKSAHDALAQQTNPAVNELIEQEKMNEHICYFLDYIHEEDDDATSGVDVFLYVEGVIRVRHSSTDATAHPNGNDADYERAKRQAGLRDEQQLILALDVDTQRMVTPPLIDRAMAERTIHDKAVKALKERGIHLQNDTEFAVLGKGVF